MNQMSSNYIFLTTVYDTMFAFGLAVVLALCSAILVSLIASILWNYIEKEREECHRQNQQEDGLHDWEADYRDWLG